MTYTPPEYKYKTLAELQDAYAHGDVTAPLYLDNDSTTVYQENEDGTWEDTFSMDPHDVLEQALDLLGIPYRHV